MREDDLPANIFSTDVFGHLHSNPGKCNDDSDWINMPLILSPK